MKRALLGLAVPALEAELQDSLGLSGGIDDGAVVLRREGHRLFAIYILARGAPALAKAAPTNVRRFISELDLEGRLALAVAAVAGDELPGLLIDPRLNITPPRGPVLPNLLATR